MKSSDVRRSTVTSFTSIFAGDSCNDAFAALASSVTDTPARQIRAAAVLIVTRRRGGSQRRPPRAETKATFWILATFVITHAGVVRVLFRSFHLRFWCLSHVTGVTPKLSSVRFELDKVSLARATQQHAHQGRTWFPACIAPVIRSDRQRGGSSWAREESAPRHKPNKPPSRKEKNQKDNAAG
jgi:hypothetical protein